MIIEINKGMDKLLFGMTIGEIEEVLGKPDKINTEELSDYEVYYYNRIYTKLKFYNKNESRLKTIETYNKEISLLGQKIANKPKQEVIKLLNDNNIPYTSFELNDYGDFDTIFVKQFYMTIAFMFDKVVSVEFSITV